MGRPQISPWSYLIPQPATGSRDANLQLYCSGSRRAVGPRLPGASFVAVPEEVARKSPQMPPDHGAPVAPIFSPVATGWRHSIRREYSVSVKYLIFLVPPPRLERGTPRSTIWCSNQLSYGGASGANLKASAGDCKLFRFLRIARLHPTVDPPLARVFQRRAFSPRRCNTA